jgi:hypothetical protein
MTYRFKNIIKKYIYGFFLAVLITSIFLVACEQTGKGKSIEGSIERIGVPIITTVHFVENQATLKRRYETLNGRPAPDGQVGFAMWNEFVGGEIDLSEGVEYRCTIYVIRPNTIDDRNVLTLGHEMLHCILGTYHSE